MLADKSNLFVLAMALLVAALIPLGAYLDKQMRLPRSSDVLLASFPRSGSFWVRFMLAHAAVGDAVVVDFHNLEELFPDLEYGPNRKIYVGEDKPSAEQEGFMRLHKRVELPPIYKSHMPLIAGAEPPCFDSIGPGVEEFACQCPNCPPHFKRVIYLVRDGRDVMCSYYSFQKTLGHESANATFVEFLQSEVYPGVSWAKHASSYSDFPTPEVSAASGKSEADEQKAPEVLWLRYEDLHEDPLRELKRIMKFLGVRATEVVLKESVRKSGYEVMRETEEDGGLKLFDKHYSQRDPSFRVVRKGKVGSWRECFAKEGSPEEIDEEARKVFNAESFATMKKLGYLEDENWS
uniref:Sulfotransferase domain-containing protein n=1 Tax=Pinguiococcus pyrenoidosus TaxID=172671 RepID=A0A7R9UAB6_9STRA